MLMLWWVRLLGWWAVRLDRAATMAANRYEREGRRLGVPVTPLPMEKLWDREGR